MVTTTVPESPKSVETWNNDPAIEARNQIVEQYLPLVRAIAADVCASTSANVEYDDLFGNGVFGLIDAAGNFDPERNVKFSTYCKRRVRGAMLDGLRQMDWVPRLTRQRNSQLRNARSELEIKLNRKPTVEELADAMDVNVDTLKKIRADAELVTIVSLNQTTGQDQNGKTKQDHVVDQNAQNPVYELQKKDSRNFIIKSLNKLEKLIVTFYYYEQLTMGQIGKMLDISESRVSQIHTEILGHLRDRIMVNKEEFVLAL